MRLTITGVPDPITSTELDSDKAQAKYLIRRTLERAGDIRPKYRSTLTINTK